MFTRSPRGGYFKTAELFEQGWRFARFDRGLSSTAYRSLGVEDVRGRVLGYGLTLQTIEVTIDEDTPHDSPRNGRSCHSLAFRGDAGTWFSATVFATRDGKHFGACQRGDEFRTIEERDAYIARRVAASHKDSARKAAKGKG